MDRSGVDVGGLGASAGRESAGGGAFARDAFVRAALSSERLRAKAVLVLLGCVIAIAATRGLLFEEEVEPRLALTATVVLLAAAGYEVWLLRFLSRLSRSGRGVPAGLSRASVIIECSIPTVSLVLASQSVYFGAYGALSTPIVLGYALFIGVSVLRLSPGLSVLSGVVSAAGHASVTTVTVALVGRPETAGLLRLEVYYSFPLLLLLCGGVAGFVASRARAYVRSAAEEAGARRKVQADLAVAREIQRALLPEGMPVLEGVEVAASNRPADETGGDFYDWVGLGDGRVAVVIADVTGHGVGPAIIAGACRAYVRAFLESEADLTRALVAANAALRADLAEGRFVTLAAAVVEPASGGVELLSAGQGPVLVRRAASGRVESIAAQGVPLGVLGDPMFDPPARLVLGPGDALVMLTDGFFEWSKPGGGQVGMGPLEACVRGARGGAAAMIDGLHRAVAAEVGDEPQADDLTALVVMRGEVGPG